MSQALHLSRPRNCGWAAQPLGFGVSGGESVGRTISVSHFPQKMTITRNGGQFGISPRRLPTKWTSRLPTWPRCRPRDVSLGFRVINERIPAWGPPTRGWLRCLDPENLRTRRRDIESDQSPHGSQSASHRAPPSTWRPRRAGSRSRSSCSPARVNTTSAVLPRGGAPPADWDEDAPAQQPPTSPISAQQFISSR
jgi:hypothetical protein